MDFEFLDYNELVKVDLYAILEVNNNATSDEIKKSFKKIVIKYHPDKNPNLSQHQKELYEYIQVAYFILSNPTKREKYDEARKQNNNLFNILKGQSQNSIKHTTPTNMGDAKKQFAEQVKELEKKHGLVDFRDMQVNTRLKEVEQNRRNLSYPKPIISGKVTPVQFNESFNKHINETNSYDLVKYECQELTPIGNFISLANFNDLYINGGSNRIFNNNFSTLDEAFNNKFIKTDNNFNTHNLRNPSNKRELEIKMEFHKRNFN